LLVTKFGADDKLSVEQFGALARHVDCRILFVYYVNWVAAIEEVMC
jgi:hypothetical protein